MIAYIVLAPVLGGLLSGADRVISARMQGRVGPPLLQPFYDVFKLLQKESITVNGLQNFYVYCFLIFVVMAGALFFSGGDILLVIFALTLANIFFIVGGYSTNSPFSHVGAQREILMMMSYEPMVLISAIGFYTITNSFDVSGIMGGTVPPVVYLPLLFLGFVYILTIKFRKSPFDLSTSHHGHQEIVKGITTEYSGRGLAAIEVAHWYENIYILGFVYLFFSWNNILSPIVGIVACLVTYFAEIVIDNSFARVKWQLALKSSWIVALAVGFVNLFILLFK
jgi:formate hydrogenlyase subunit 4